MGTGNWSQVTEFIILGFPYFQGVQTYLFVLLLSIYLTTILGNLLGWAWHPEYWGTWEKRGLINV